jgi:hypothetical protein
MITNLNITSVELDHFNYNKFYFVLVLISIGLIFSIFFSFYCFLYSKEDILDLEHDLSSYPKTSNTLSTKKQKNQFKPFEEKNFSLSLLNLTE